MWERVLSAGLPAAPDCFPVRSLAFVLRFRLVGVASLALARSGTGNAHVNFQSSNTLQTNIV